MKAGDILKLDISKMTEAERIYYTELIAKYNPYHDELGRFATHDGAFGFSSPRNPRHLKNERIPAHIKVITRSGSDGKRIKQTGLGAIPDPSNQPQTTTKPKKPKQPKQPKKVPQGHDEVLAHHEERIRSKKVEHAVVVDKDGNVLVNKRGSKSQVKFTASECSLMRDATLTHNHPRGTCFSPADIQLAIKQNANEIRVAGSTGMTYSFKHTGSVQNYQQAADNFMRKFDSEFNNFVSDARDRTTASHHQKYVKGEITGEQIQRVMDKNLGDAVFDWLSSNSSSIGWETTKTGEFDLGGI